eukprot:scaffold219843_cov53-Attheya_sp.AAC.5
MAFSTHSFFILRHGQTDANAGGILQGSSDFSRLTEQGRAQAAELATQRLFWKNQDGSSRGTQEQQQQQQPSPFQSIYVSPLTRARETLSILLLQDDDRTPEAYQNDSPTGNEPITCTVLDNLREIDLYDWEGCHKDELTTKFPESYHAWKVGDPYNFVVPNSKHNNSIMDHDDDEHENNNNETTTTTITDQRYPLLELWERADQ